MSQLGRIVNEKVNVIVLTIAFNQLRFKIGADFCEYSLEVTYRQIRQNITPTFGNKDQIDVQHVNDMPAGAMFHLPLPWANRIIPSIKRRGYQYKMHPSDEQVTLFLRVID